MPSAVRNIEGFASARFKFGFLGGELGGSIVTAGDIICVETGPMEIGRCPVDGVFTP